MEPNRRLIVIAASLAIRYRISRIVEIGGEAMYFYSQFDGPSAIEGGWTSVSGRRSLNDSSFGLNLRVSVPGRKVRPFAELGMGLNNAAISADEYDYSQLVSWFGVPSGQWEDSETGLTPLVTLGAEFDVSREIAIDLEYRHMWVEGDFGALTGGRTPIAGSFYSVALRRALTHGWTKW